MQQMKCCLISCIKPIAFLFNISFVLFGSAEHINPSYRYSCSYSLYNKLFVLEFNG